MPICLLFILAAPPIKAEKPDRKAQIQAARQVVAAVVESAQANARSDRPKKGDELTELYVRAAAARARKLPSDRAAWAFLLAVGVALDRSTMLRSNPLTMFTWRQVETDAERKKRLAVLGEPTMHGRHDLAQHCFVSAALTASSGARFAEALGVTKEWMDSGEGGSGFSFAVLAADLAGIELAARLLDRPARLEAIAKGFRVADHCPPPKGLPEGLKRKAFVERYGSTSDERFKKELEALRKKVRALPGHRDKE